MLKRNKKKPDYTSLITSMNQLGIEVDKELSHRAYTQMKNRIERITAFEKARNLVIIIGLVCLIVIGMILGISAIPGPGKEKPIPLTPLPPYMK